MSRKVNVTLAALIAGISLATLASAPASAQALRSGAAEFTHRDALVEQVQYRRRYYRGYAVALIQAPPRPSASSVSRPGQSRVLHWRLRGTWSAIRTGSLIARPDTARSIRCAAPILGMTGIVTTASELSG